MSIPSQSDFINWRQDPVTRAFYLAIAEYIGQVKENLSMSAGLDATQDNFHRGCIRALQDALEFRIEDLQETVE